MTLTVTFVRHRQRRDRIYVARHDGTSCAWDFPSYGDRLPHDLVHLVVEEGLGIVDGFWGMVDAGADVTLVDNRATLVRGGKPLAAQPGIDVSELRRAEEAVGLLSPTGGLAPDVGAGTVPGSEAEIAATRRRLDDLGRRWRHLDDGAAITVTYGGAGRRSHQVGGPDAISTGDTSEKPRRP